MQGQALRVIRIDSGHVVISDPCYDPDSYGYFSHAAKNGEWMTYIAYDPQIKTPVFLGAVHLDYENDYLRLHSFDLEDVLGVDSGQMSIYDKTEYDLAHQSKANFDSFYHTIAYGYDGTKSEGTLSNKLFYADNFGIASSTHYGDGVCYAMLFTEDGNPDSPLIAIEIDLC